MENNIFNKVENYLLNRKDIYGDKIFIEKDALINEDFDNNTDIKELNKKEKDFKGTVDIEWKNSNDLPDLKQKIHNCKECELGETRNKFVFGSGNPNADIMIIGEAPGRDEDAQGEPFVGRAGQLLTKILEAINLTREEVFIANIIKCRPPGNRVPEKSEVDKCEPYLKKQIELIKPQFILSLGLTSINTLLKQKFKMADIRGNLMEYHGIKLLVTYHPAALLRNPNWKKSTWQDVKLLRKLYDEYLQTKS